MHTDEDGIQRVWNQFWQAVADDVVDDPDHLDPATLAVMDAIRAVIECARLVRYAPAAERAAHEATLTAALHAQTAALHHWRHTRP